MKETHKKINWMKYRPLYFCVSGGFVLLGIFSLLKWGLNLGVEFRGGVSAEYSMSQRVNSEEVKAKLSGANIALSSLQTLEGNSVLLQFQELSEDQRVKLKEVMTEVNNGQEAKEVQFQNIGPTIGPELVTKTIFAIVLAAIAILAWVAYQFRNIIYGSSAIIAMLHDTFILIGMFSFLGHIFGAEVDFLFVTAVLTTLSFSVHDTIVVYDRIREIRKKHGGNIVDIANTALSETMRRSVNNSLTIIIMLVALIVLGGTSIRWFAIALLIGTISGTYSSPFVAVPLLVTWANLSKKQARKN